MEFDFSQNTSVTDINKVPQDFRGLYKATEDGTKHVLDTENAGVKSAVSAITGLATALKAARKEKVSQVDLTPLKDFGTDPQAIADAFNSKLNGLQEQIKGVNVEKIKEDLAKDWKTKVDTHEATAKTLEGQLYGELVESRATSAIASEEGDVELLIPFVTKQIKATRGQDGKYHVNVVDGAGDIRYSGVTGAPMSIKELVSEMKANEKFGRLFKSAAKPGSGSPPGAASQRQGTASGNPAEMTAAQKISAGLAKGQAGRAGIRR